MNVSIGTAGRALDAVVSAAGGDLLDLHADAFHNRAVLTLVGEAAPRRVAEAGIDTIDLRSHRGVHPRIGAVDVVPFVPLEHATLADAIAARDRFARWAGTKLHLPCFLYGPERSLPEVRRHAFDDLAPAFGPARPHPRAGGCAVGARPVLVAYNVWLPDGDVDLARRVARAVRSDQVRALGLDVGGRAQVSMNLVAPEEVGPAEAFDHIASLTAVEGTELVGLVPEAVLTRIPESRWAALDLAWDRTIEARLARWRSQPAAPA